MMISWIVAIVFWLDAIYFLIKNNQNLFWYSVLISFTLTFLSKELLKIRKKLEIS